MDILDGRRRGETRLMNRDRVIRRRMSQSDFPFSPLLLADGCAVDVFRLFLFFFLPSFASFVTFPPAVANGTVGKKKKKVCGEGRRKDVGVVCWVNPGGDVFALE